MANEIKNLHNSIAGVKPDWRQDWKEDAIADWKVDFTTDSGTPVNTVIPAITGNLVVGQVLTSSTGTWTATPAATYTYQWFRGNTLISGATSSTYTLVTADAGLAMTVRVRAQNTKGEDTVSAVTLTNVGAPANTVAPAITGNAYVASTLTCSTGTWVPAATSYAYQWYRDDVLIGGATAATRVLAGGDLGAVMHCAVTATNASGTSLATVSNDTAVVIAIPVNTVAPAITGTAQEGQTLSLSNGTWTGGGSISYVYAWYANDVLIGGATANTYVPLLAHVGAVIHATVDATNAAGSGAPVASNDTAVVIAA